MGYSRTKLLVMLVEELDRFDAYAKRKEEQVGQMQLLANAAREADDQERERIRHKMRALQGVSPTVFDTGNILSAYRRARPALRHLMREQQKKPPR